MPANYRQKKWHNMPLVNACLEEIIQPAWHRHMSERKKDRKLASVDWYPSCCPAAQYAVLVVQIQSRYQGTVRPIAAMHHITIAVIMPSPRLKPASLALGFTQHELPRPIFVPSLKVAGRNHPFIKIALMSPSRPLEKCLLHGVHPYAIAEAMPNIHCDPNFVPFWYGSDTQICCTVHATHGIRPCSTRRLAIQILDCMHDNSRQSPHAVNTAETVKIVNVNVSTPRNGGGQRDV